MTLIESLEYGEIVLEGKTYYSDMIISWDGMKEMLAKTHCLTLDELKSVLKRKPEAIVIGVGLEGTVKIHPEISSLLKKRKISLFVDRTINAKEIYNAFHQVGKKVIAIIHVTL